MTNVVVRPALVVDAEAFVGAHESAWDATIGPLVGRSLAELAPFDERVSRYRAGFDATPPDIGVWVAEREGVGRRSELPGEAVLRARGMGANGRDPFKPAETVRAALPPSSLTQP